MKDTIVYTNDMPVDELINNLAALRRFKGIKQTDVGVMVGSVKSNISRMEHNLHSPTFKTLKAYIEALGYDFEIVLWER